jgi:hypothetical protein
LTPILWFWFVLLAQIQSCRIEDGGDGEPIAKVIDCFAGFA